jgi:Family of unknown function (DUF6291)
MADNKKSFILYCDQKGVWDKLNDDQAGKLIKHIISYVNDENPIVPDFIIELAFEPIKQQLKRDLRKWEKQYQQRVEAGKKSAEVRKRNSTTVNERLISSTVNVNVNGNVNEIHKRTDRKILINLSIQISLTYRKRYDRHEGGQIGQDIEDMVEFLLKSMTQAELEAQIRNHKLYIGLSKLTLPSRLETIQQALLETDWVSKVKELQEIENLINNATNEQLRRIRKPADAIPAASDERIDSE